MNESAYLFPAMRVAVLCVALMAGLVFALGLRVSQVRLQFTGEPDPEKEESLKKAIRAHGNAAEYVPTLAILILLLASQGAGPLVQTLFMLATAARFSHAFGMLTCKSRNRPDPFRFAGATGTYVCGLLMALLLIFR